MITRRTFTTGAVTMLAAGHLSTRAMAATASWDMSTVWPDGNFHTHNAMAFADAVKKQTDGAVNITVKAGGQLGFKGPEHLRAVRDGLVPLADVLNIQQVGDEPFMGVESIPFLAVSMDELKVLHKYVRPEYDKIAERNNQKILYIVPWPTQYLHLKVKVAGVDGLEEHQDPRARQERRRHAERGRHGAGHDSLGRDDTGAGVGRGRRRFDLGGIRRRRQVLGVHEVHLSDQPCLVVADADRQSRFLEGVERGSAEDGRRHRREDGAGFLGEFAQGRRRQPQPPQGGRHGVVPVSDAMMTDIRTKTAPLLEAFLKRVPAADKPVRAYLAEIKR
jgi:hypothetical protein